MGSPADAATLANSFEPILLFHQDEAFFPLDPKWYLERCALWKTAPPFADKTKWAQPPVIAKGTIAANNGAAEVAGGKTWIGTPGQDFGVGPLPVGQQPPPDEEHFLEFVGWEPVAVPPVTATTDNRHAALDPAEYLVPLQGSQAWYYVEYLDNNDLLDYTGNPNVSAGGLNLYSLVASNPKLNAPRMLLYHFLYPLHQETLEGCEDVLQGRLFGTYAGEWTCIALLIDGSPILADAKPLFVGLTSRNTSSPIVAPDHKIGMTVFNWTDADSVPDASGGTHPKIYVSLDTHGEYLHPGTPTVTPFWPGGVDPARSSCGQVEGLDGEIAQDITIPGTPDTPGRDPNAVIAVAKIFAGLLAGSPFGGYIGAAAGAAAGLEWATAEGAFGSFGATGTPATLVLPKANPTDQTGGPNFGRILRPKGLDFPEAHQALSVDDWNVRTYTAPAPDGRAYTYIVNRANQVWWAPRPTPRPGKPDLPNPDGFSGRWGPRVTNDPNIRRAGMKCPDFALMFLEALAVKLQMP
ncbi:MAG TPA: hypothetical protein VKW08_22895 [Xanthobacteraceae bacterium]|nr:hypothetical protein [Xanthobacteraceae bacterium]